MTKSQTFILSLACVLCPLALFQMSSEYQNKFGNKFSFIWNDPGSSQMSSKDAGPFNTLNECETELTKAKNNNAHIYRDCVKN